MTNNQEWSKKRGIVKNQNQYIWSKTFALTQKESHK